MKLKKCTGLVLAACVSVVSVGRAAVIEKPAVMKDALVTVTVSDVQGFIDGLGSVTKLFDPTLNSAMLKSSAGMFLGDFTLKGMPKGKGLALVVLDPETIFAVAEVDSESKDLYMASLEGNGVMSKYANGLLVVAVDPLQLDRCVELAPAVQQQLLAKRSASLRVSCSPSILTKQYDALIAEGVAGLLEGISYELDEDVAPVGRILEAEVRVLLSLVSQCEAYGLEITPKDGSVLLNEVCTAVPGSRLDTFLKAPKVNKPDPQVQSGMLADGAISIDGLLANPDALNTLIAGEAKALQTEMEIDGEVVSSWLDMMKKWTDVMGGSVAETIGFGGDSFIQIQAIENVKDADKALALMKTMQADIAPFMELYEKMGIPMSMEFKNDAREYKGTQIHQMLMKMNATEPEMAMAFEMMNISEMKMEYAVVDGKMVYAMGDSIDTLIDRVKSGEMNSKPLRARSVFPADADFYCDVDLVQYVQGILSVIPEDAGVEEVQMALAALEGAESVVMAGYMEKGSAMFSCKVPKSLLAKVGAMIREQQARAQAQMEAMMMEMDGSSVEWE